MSTAFETYSLHGIASLVNDLGQPKFRAKQLVEWVYGKGATDYDAMTNLPASLRSRLTDSAPLNIPVVIDKRISKDGARKYVLELVDGARIETVGIPSRETSADGSPKRLTVCFSTQVGCPMACAFCATGTAGLTRNLFPGEIAQQVLTVSRDLKTRVTNAVAMGQGEPFLNYRNVIDGLQILNNAKALNIGARHITVSTCGILQGIDDFAHEPEQYTLALSLHSAIQSKRDLIMPKCTAIPIEALKEALNSYRTVSTRRPSIEYLMMTGVNDGDEDLEALIDFCSGLSVHVNLLPMNHVEGSPYKASDKKVMKVWVNKLSRAGIESNIRDSRGSDIDGACGQLVNRLH